MRRLGRSRRCRTTAGIKRPSDSLSAGYLGLPTRAMGGRAGADGREIRRLVNRRQETRLTKRVSRIYAPHPLSPWRGILDGFIPPSGHSTGGTTVNNNPRKLIIRRDGDR